MTNRHGSFRLLPATLTAFLLICGVANAAQHIVRAGTDWSLLDKRVKPGDEIVLLPGEHRSVTLDNARGTFEKPIVIRSVDPDHLAVIKADLYGIRLRDPQHVEIRDLMITGAKINGVALEGSARSAGAAGEQSGETPGHVTIRNVAVLNTGPQGLRYAIDIERMSHVTVQDCRISAWAGSGIEIVGSSDVTVRDTGFSGRENFTQLSGIRVRAGSERVFIDRCTFVDAGDQAVCIGGKSEMNEFRTAPTEDAQTGTLYEAANVQVTRCIIVRGRSAVAFVNCRHARVRNCTIVRPQRAVFSIRDEQDDPRFGGTRQSSIGSNLIVWKPGDIEMITHLAGGADVSGISLEQNLWWSPQLAENLEALGPFPGVSQFPQLTDVDPKLDADLQPQEPQAELFGAKAP
jgi:hypothetical protein